LNLLRLMTVHQLQQSDVSMLLLSPFWSASHREADARALLDASMREKLPMQFTLSRLLEFIKEQQAEGLRLEMLLANIHAAAAIPSTRKLPTVQWAQTLDAILNALGWPGERTINSLEYQALNAWQKALQERP
jgi:exodeoxyribonuclease-5